MEFIILLDQLLVYKIDAIAPARERGLNLGI
nr:MAG TPA: hypothetical protein [Caudoviricetes sp.]